MVLFFAVMLWIFSIKQGFNAVTASIVLGVILLVLIPCQWPFLRKTLESPPLRFLGRISYSFYLLHFPIMLLTCGLLASRHLSFLICGNRFVSTLILFVISVSITLLIGHFSERLVEAPWNRLARELSSRLLLVSK
jgi:peptidoglycan/LPS O-acetylase OafA/YrhL